MQQAAKATQPQTWHDLRAFFESRYLNGNTNSTIRHTTQAIFELLRETLPPLATCKAAGRLLKACKEKVAIKDARSSCSQWYEMVTAIAEAESRAKK